MKKLLGIVVLGLLLSGNAYSKTIGETGDRDPELIKELNEQVKTKRKKD